MCRFAEKEREKERRRNELRGKTVFFFFFLITIDTGGLLIVYRSMYVSQANKIIIKNKDIGNNSGNIF